MVGRAVKVCFLLCLLASPPLAKLHHLELCRWASSPDRRPIREENRPAPRIRCMNRPCSPKYDVFMSSLRPGEPASQEPDYSCPQKWIAATFHYVRWRLSRWCIANLRGEGDSRVIPKTATTMADVFLKCQQTGLDRDKIR